MPKEPTEGTVGTAAIVNQILSVAVPRRTVTLTCTGLTRIRLLETFNKKNYSLATVAELEDKIGNILVYISSIL